MTINFLEKNQLEKLLQAPLETRQEKIFQLRDHLILELLYSTGLKVSELINLNEKQVNLKKGTIDIVGHNDKTRTVLLPNQTQHWLKQYLEIKNNSSLNLFTRHDRAGKKKLPKNLTARSIQRLIKKYTKQVGIAKKITPHTLRQIFAVNLLVKGTDICDIQKIMGHISLNTTKRYL